MEQIKLVAKQLILNIKGIFANKVNIIFISVFTLVSIFVPIIFIPFWISMAIIFTLPLIPLCGAVYASTDYNFRKSTLYSNMSMTKGNKFTFHIGSLLATLIVAFVFTTFLYCLLGFLNEFHIFLIDWRKYPSPGDNSFNEIWDGEIKFSASLYSIIIIASLEASLMVYAISFAFQHLIKTEKSYFTLILSLTILTIIFGGAINNYFLPTPYDNVGGKPIYLFDESLFPKEMFIPSALFPFFASGEKMSMAAKASQTSSAWYWDMYNNLFPILFCKTNSLGYQIAIFTQYGEIILFFIIGLAISIFKKAN